MIDVAFCPPPSGRGSFLLPQTWQAGKLVVTNCTKQNATRRVERRSCCARSPPDVLRFAPVQLDRCIESARFASDGVLGVPRRTGGILRSARRNTLKIDRFVARGQLDGWRRISFSSKINTDARLISMLGSVRARCVRGEAHCFNGHVSEQSNCTS